MSTTATLRVAAPRMMTVRNRSALLHHLTDRIDRGARDVVIGLEGTVYVDSAALAMLVELHRVRVRKPGGRLRVSGATGELRLLFEATRLTRVLEIVDAVEDCVTDEWLAPDGRIAAAPAQASSGEIFTG
jgi:anti-anti-sigma factor